MEAVVEGRREEALLSVLVGNSGSIQPFLASLGLYNDHKNLTVRKIRSDLHKKGKGGGYLGLWRQG